MQVYIQMYTSLCGGLYSTIGHVKLIMILFLISLMICINIYGQKYAVCPKVLAYSFIYLLKF